MNLYLCVNFVDGPIGDQQSQQAFSNGSTVENLMQNFTLFQNHFKVSEYCSSWVLGNLNLRTEMKYRRKGKSVGQICSPACLCCSPKCVSVNCIDLDWFRYTQTSQSRSIFSSPRGGQSRFLSTTVFRYTIRYVFLPEVYSNFLYT